MSTWTTPAGSASRLCLDILKQPHALIAGTTGSGKSTLMNAILYTALYKAPGYAAFALIDTKLTELRRYARLPHTVAYCTTPGEAARTLTNVLRITRERGARAAAQGLRASQEAPLYVVIDELGDLVLTDKGLAGILGQIAMIGRAANVHIIAGTQCPNRKTLSAEFAANMPARVGLRCLNAIESRQIIGTADAVKLPRCGKGLYIAPQYPRPVPVNIPFVDDEELEARVNWWCWQNAHRPR